MARFKDFVEANPSADLSDGAAKFAMLDPDGSNAEATLTAVAAAPAFADQYLSQTDAAEQYAPLSSEQIWLPLPGVGVITGGTPAAILFASRWSAIAFDQSTNESWSVTVEMPASWSTATFSILWSQASAGSGNVVWALTLDAAADGETLNASGSGASSTIAAPAQNILKVSALRSNISITPSKLYGLRLARTASDGADTLAADAAVLGILVERVSV